LKRLGTLKDLDRMVDEAMSPENIRIELIAA
jgi:hypothetical protein